MAWKNLDGDFFFPQRSSPHASVPPLACEKQNHGKKCQIKWVLINSRKGVLTMKEFFATTCDTLRQLGLFGS